MVVFLVLFGLVLASVATSTLEVSASRRGIDEVRAHQLAESGIERGIHFLNETAKLNAFNPLEGLKGIFQGAPTATPFLGERVVDGTSTVGAYTVTLTLQESTDTSLTVLVQSTGYLPDAPANLPAGQSPTLWSAVEASVLLALEPSEVFNYSYFINNWGWFYGNTIHANGNVRSNGQFDVGGFAPWANGQPLYDFLNWVGGAADLSGYHDDNGDGLMDGKDGGVWSGWDIVNAQNLQGTGGLAMNQHEFQPSVPMPNLSDLSLYEARAIDQGSSLAVGGIPVSDSVYGDAPGERQNLYLIGTPANPVVLNGPVVVRGDVIISGYVTGQGSIYAGGNVYVPDSIRYLDGPATPRPTGTTEAETEAWLTANQGKDFLGLFARENVVVGDHTHPVWRDYVSSWMASPMNKSEEDAGEDGIPNTAPGLDGIPGTADDDVLEDDGIFTTETYTTAHEALGQIPPGFSVGDVIPGTGEDIDGDGNYDATTSLADVDLKNPLNPTYWGGNMPGGGVASYSDIASLYANNLDAVFYTNHTFCYLVVGNQPARINGALVSRNEDIIYGTPTIEINHDARLLAGNMGIAGDLLPATMGSPVILRWSRLENDPNRYQGVQP